MPSLGDKVTRTIVDAILSAMEAVGFKHNQALRNQLESQIGTYLGVLDPTSDEYKAIISITSYKGIFEILLMLAGSVMGVIQSLWTMGTPTAEQLGQASWQVKPVKIAPAPNIITAAWRGAIGFEDAALFLKRLGYDTLAQDVLTSALRQPLRVEDILELRRRGDIDSEKMTRLLDGAGYDPEARAGLLQLQWRIPGVQDLIRMAVKEAFTPEIAEQFGQYADFPAAIAEWTAKQGLSAEWTQRYWAAHWDLPSTTQGYEMLHRGVIKEEELDLLLRAQDVMPWWRDKLKAIAFNPLTRVDVRRMYQLGVLDEPGVIRAYKELGYNAENSQRMLEFTKIYYGPEDETGEEADRDWTKAEILDGYRKRIITADQARMALREMSYNEAKIDFFLAREDLKAVQSRKQAYLDRWHSLYINGIAGAQDVYTNLEALGISQAEVDELLPLWNLEQLQAVTRPTKAERLKWFKAGIISQATWEAELRLDGYSDAYIAMYLADAQSA